MLPITIKEITSVFPPSKFIGNENTLVEKLVSLDDYNGEKNVLGWCSAKNIRKLQNIDSGTFIVPEEAMAEVNVNGCNYIVVENPRQYFANVLTEFFFKPDQEISTSNLARISSSSQIGKNVFIAPYVVIRENCVIGDNARISNNTVIYPGTIVGNHTIIGANNIIGDHGFGYEKNTEGTYMLMPHVGNVIIGAHVEIGNNNCIDRAVLGSTIIGDHTKIHNFVQVAHGVQIGSNCLITANVTVSGSTKIGSGVWVGPGVTVSNKVTIGDFARLSIGAVVLTDVPEHATVSGNPGRIIKTNAR